MIEKYKKINGNTLKLIALITMLIDHVAILFMAKSSSLPFSIVSVYDIMRAIGRTAFPLYCFLLVEGFIHTSSKKKYIISMLILAIVSEPVYHLYFNTGINKMLLMKDDVNICFELLYSLIMLSCVSVVENHIKDNFKCSVAQILIATMFILASIWLPFDYAAGGVLLVAALYIFRDMPVGKLLLGYTSLQLSGMELWAVFAFILMYFYSGKRGKDLGRYKYMFYAFYPLHILILYLFLIYG